MLDTTLKSSLEIKGEVLKSIINDLNADRTAVLDTVITDSSKRNDMIYVSSIESLIRQLVSYQSLLDRSDTDPL